MSGVRDETVGGMRDDRALDSTVYLQNTRPHGLAQVTIGSQLRVCIAPREDELLYETNEDREKETISETASQIPMPKPQ